MKETLTVKRESLPVRCEVCHQTDLFNPETGICQRCSVAVIQTNEGPVAVDGVIGQLAIHRWNIPDEFRHLFLEAVGDEPVLWVGRPNVPVEAGRSDTRLYLESGILAFSIALLAVYLLFFDKNLFRVWMELEFIVMFGLIVMWFRTSETSFQSEVLYALTPTRCLKIGPRSVPIERIPLSPQDLDCVMVDPSRDFGHLVLFRDFKFGLGFDVHQGQRGFFYIENVHMVERIVREHLLKGVERVGNTD